MPTGYKYRSTGGFSQRIPEPSIKGCLYNILILATVVTVIVSLSIKFGWS